MEGVSLSSSTAQAVQASLSLSQSQAAYDVAVAQKAQEAQQQMGSAAVELIQASLNLIDVRA